MKTQVYIDPRCMFNYASYYILGCFNSVGPARVNYDISAFQNIRLPYRHGVMLIFENGEHLRKNIFIDFHDSDHIIDHLYEWCDVYAKVNLHTGADLLARPKLLPIGPGFSIRLYNYPQLLKTLISNYALSSGFTETPLLYYLRDYLYTCIRRSPFALFNRSPSCDNYIFAISTLWYDEYTAITTNRYRGVFIRESKKRSRFEGGFFYIPDKYVIKQNPEYERYRNEYADTISFKRYSNKAYITKTKQSSLVFNTPSVLGCHGWKLGEYLCLGKAVISTPMNNRMPGEFKHGVHYHLVRTESEIGDAIDLILNDTVYRKSLENAAYEYYENYLKPEAVIRHIFNKAFNPQ